MYVYTNMPMPHSVSVTCPSCNAHGIFTFSTFSECVDRKDRSYFESSKSFETEWVKHSTGQWKYRVWHDFGRGRKSLDVIKDLPSDVSKKQFRHSSYYWGRRNRNRGVIKCQSCNYNRLHKLNWPEDAYFKTIYKRHTLWAFDRNMGIRLLNYLKSSERKKRVYGVMKTHYGETKISDYDAWLRNLPTVFQTKKAKVEIVRKLEKVLKL